MYIDTHCHISKDEYDDINEVINKLDKNYAITSGDSHKSNIEVLEIVNRYSNIYGTIGIHPNEIADFKEEYLKFIEKNLSNQKIVGIGEIGLDYHYGKEDNEKQKEIFVKQLDLARKYKKTVVIHSRDAAQDTLEIIKNYPDLKIDFHCYGYSLDIAKELLKQNVKFGIGGVITFKNSRVLKEVVEFLPYENILLETDSPYLSPEPFRGKKNIPNNVELVAKKIAEIKEIPYEKVLEITTINAKSLFDLKI